MAALKKTDTAFIGKCNFRGNERIFGAKQRDRRQHMYVIGKTGVGKTALLKNLALQDIRAGHGIGIIDPHGEFVEEVLSQIPPERMEDVVYFNPVDSEYPIGFNVLEVPDVKYKHLVVSDLLGIFTKIWANVWSARMEYILQNCILALIDTPGTTLLGIPRILVDKDYREKIVANVADPVVRSFWINEYETWRDQFRNEAIVPIQNKVGQFLNTGFIRNIVGQPTSSLNIPQLMNEGKILLVNVSKGKVGEDNSALLGAMIITKVQLAAMERVRIAEEERRDFYLYVDEFQNFATDSFATILSEARKYRLNLIIAHQYVGQLVTDVSTKVRDAVFGNVGTMISFRVGATDAEFLEKEFEPEFAMQDLIGLPNHHIYLKLMVDGVTSRPFSAVTLPPLKFEVSPDVKERILKLSREKYGRPHAEVEAKIAAWSGVGSGEGAGFGGGEGAGPGGKFEAVCWNCGKTATVPFKPDGKRPVYCSSCLKKIEEGTLVPLPDRMPHVGKARFAPSLEGLGIEFAPAAPSAGGAAPRTGDRRPAPGGARPYRGDRPPRQDFHASGGERRNAPRPPERHGPRDERRPPPGGGSRAIHSTPAVRPAATAKPVSLSALAERDAGAAVKEQAHAPRPERQRGPNPGRPEAPKPAPDLAGLKSVLGDVLKKSPIGAPAQSGESSPPAHEKEPRPDDVREKNVIRPGDTIKFS